jgi:hypothetical protein
MFVPPLLCHVDRVCASARLNGRTSTSSNPHPDLSGLVARCFCTRCLDIEAGVLHNLVLPQSTPIGVPRARHTRFGALLLLLSLVLCLSLDLHRSAETAESTVCGFACSMSLHVRAQDCAYFRWAKYARHVMPRAAGTTDDTWYLPEAVRRFEQ